MSRLRILLLVIAVAAVILFLSVLARTAILGTTFPGGVIVTGEYSQTDAHEGDLLVASKNITFSGESSVSGNVSLVGETIHLAGRIDGDLTILADHVFLDGGSVGGKLQILADDAFIAAQIGGDATLKADILTLDAGASFIAPPAVCAPELIDSRDGGQVNACPSTARNPFEELLTLRALVQSGTVDESAGGQAAYVLMALLAVIAFVAAAALVVSLFPERLARVVRTMNRRPARSASVGIGVFMLVCGLTGGEIVLLGSLTPAGLVALPLYLLFVLGILLLSMVGLIALALLIGARIVGGKPGNAQPPLVAAAVGGLVVAVALAVIILQPFGQVVSLILFSGLAVVGTGAALHTRLGAPVSPRTT